MRPGRGIDFRDKAAAFLRGGSPGKSTIRVHPPPRKATTPEPVRCATVRVVSHSGLLRLAQQGHVRHPTKRRRGTRHFCDVFLQRLQTNPPVIDGSTKSWNAGGVTTSPETVRRLMQPGGPGGGVSPAPRPTTTVPAADLAGRPDLIERNFTADAPVPETGGRPSPICFSPGKDSCTRQAVTRPLCLKRIVDYAMAEHMRTELAQNALQNWRLGTASPSRV